MPALTESQLEDAKRYQYAFLRHIPYVTTMIQGGASVIDCADEICRKEGWCFVTDKEMKFLEYLMEFVIK
jgi:hypothetical protein